MKKSGNKRDRQPTVAYCGFCGSKPGQISERTERLATAVYFCPKCVANYCDQCSAPHANPEISNCLRCDSEKTRVAHNRGKVEE